MQAKNKVIVMLAVAYFIYTLGEYISMHSTIDICVRIKTYFIYGNRKVLRVGN